MVKLITINIIFYEEKAIGHTRYTYSVTSNMRISLKRSSDMNMMSDQWSYLYENRIFIVIIYILEHVWTMQKYLNLIIFCLLSCISWYFWGIIRRVLRIHTHLLHIGTVNVILQLYIAAKV